jgi:hypothetical protein
LVAVVVRALSAINALWNARTELHATIAEVSRAGRTEDALWLADSADFHGHQFDGK